MTITTPDSLVWLNADIWSLEREFVNLLSNAFRYTPDGGDVRLSAEVLDGQAIVRIRDSGIGIAPDALAHVFELFNQADETEARSEPGLGIGLAVVSRLIGRGHGLHATSLGNPADFAHHNHFRHLRSDEPCSSDVTSLER